MISLKLQGQFYPEQGISGLVSSCSDSKSDCPTFLLQTFPAAASSPPNDFTPQTLLFLKKKKKRERERKTSPVVSVRCVSSRRGSAKTRAGERLRGWERVRESRRGREKEWRVWTSAKLREADRYKTESAAEREGKEWKSKRNTHGRQRKKYKTLKTRPAEKWTSCSLWWPGFFVPVARIP